MNLKKLLSPALRRLGKKKAQPTFIKPMLATLTKDYFSRDDWIYEHKFDGERCIALKKNGTVTLKSRNNRVINSEYPELVTALEKQKSDNFIIDGEIVALNKAGVSDFQMLQSRINLKALEEIHAHVRNTPIYYCIFDLMYVDGYDITELPLLMRKKLLKKLLKYNKILVYTTHKIGDGVAYLKYACRHKWEGLIAKKSDSTYVSKRARTWLKFKCSMGQELVIGGYTHPQGSRTDFGALLVGYYAGGTFHYAGKVGTGFNETTLRLLGKKLRALGRQSCPFVDYDGTERGVQWVKPQLVADFEFAQWTAGGKLRVGRYKGLRSDKAARLVTRESRSR